MRDADLERLVPLLTRLPADAPFTSGEAHAAGVGWPALRELVDVGLLRHPVQNVYSAITIPDDLSHRVEVLRLVVPGDCVVTDRTAGWLWGADMVLAPNDHLVTPRVSVFAPPGRRLRNGLVDSGERMLAPADVVEVGGVLVTTALRTGCDLGRLLSREQSLAAMDALTRLAVFTAEELQGEVGRFKGYRGVLQLRELAPLVDAGAASPPESILRLRWLDAGLPRPSCQVEVPGPDGPFFLDLGLASRRLAAEYDGEQWHGEERRKHDEGRRAWIRTHAGWVIVVIRRRNLFGREQDVHRLLIAGNREALLRLATC